jgi:hypothetical protein
LTQTGVQCGEWFIEKKHLGLINNGTGDGNALGFSTAQSFGPGVTEFRKVCHCKEFVDPLFNLSFRYVADAGAGGDIVVNRLVREQGVVLENESDGPFLDGQVSYVFAGNENFSGVHPLKSGDQPKQRGFPTPAFAKQGVSLTQSNFQGKVMEDRFVTEVFGNGFQSDHRDSPRVSELANRVYFI